MQLVEAEELSLGDKIYFFQLFPPKRNCGFKTVGHGSLNCAQRYTTPERITILTFLAN